MSDPNPDGDVEEAPDPSTATNSPAESGGEAAGTDAEAAHGSTAVAGSGGEPAGGGGDPADGTTTADADSEPSVAKKAGIDDAVVGTARNLDPKVRYRWVVGGAVGGVVLGVVAGVLAYFLGPGTGGFGGRRTLAVGVGATVFALLLLVAVVRAVLLYRSWEYVVREDSLFLSRGVLTRVRTVAPYVRVQHVDTQRSPVERILGLSTLVVYTAGSRGADVTIPGLTLDGAADLQERLKRLAIESEEEDAV